MNVRAIFAIGAIGLPVALLLVVGLVAQQVNRTDTANLNIQRLSAANAFPRTVLALLQDAESGERGYLLTGQKRYLEPYNDAVRQMPEAIKGLEGLAALNPPSAAAVTALRKLARARLDQLALIIRLQNTGQREHALDLIRNGGGLGKMKAVRKTEAALVTQGVALIVAQIDRRQDSMRLTGELVGALLAIIVLFVIFSAVAILANFREGERIISENARTEAERANLVKQLDEERQRLLLTVRELAAAKYTAEQANKSKSEFLASMSHELRTPLNAILGFSEVIRDELFGPVGLAKYVDYANDVHKSGQHLLDLINDVLDLSKIDAGKVELHDEAVCVADLLEDCILLVRERALKSGVALKVAEVPPELSVRVDPRLSKQILLNLLSNAVKFTPRGGTVSVTCSPLNGGLVIAVKDTGIGMTGEEIEKAMTAYGQVDSKISRKHRGTGLGLPISLGLAELHGGTLRITSAPGRGSEVAFLLPADRVLAHGPARKSA